MNQYFIFALLFLIALLPALGWILVYRFLDNRDREPLKVIWVSLFFGAFSTVPVFALRYFFRLFPRFDLMTYLQANITNPILLTSLFLLFVAAIEELMKGIFLVLLVRKYEQYFNQVVDGIIYASFIGIGFAITENMYYFKLAWDIFELSFSFVAIVAIRSFGTMLAHTLFTGFFGFYYAKSYFGPFMKNRRKPKTHIRLHERFLHLFPGFKNCGGGFKAGTLVFKGFLIAVFSHFIYNALIKLEFFGRLWTFLIVPFVIFLSWFIWSRFFIILYNRIFDLQHVEKDEYRIIIH